jgi:hypothetical protein
VDYASLDAQWNEIPHWKTMNGQEERFLAKLLEKDSSFDFYWHIFGPVAHRMGPVARQRALSDYFSYRTEFNDRIEEFATSAPGYIDVIAYQADMLEDRDLFAFFTFMQWYFESPVSSYSGDPIFYDTSTVGHARDLPGQTGPNRGERITLRKKLIADIFERPQIGPIHLLPSVALATGDELPFSRYAHNPIRLAPRYERPLSSEDLDLIDRVQTMFEKLGKRPTKRSRSNPRFERFNNWTLAEHVFSSGSGPLVTQTSDLFLRLVEATNGGVHEFSNAGHGEYTDEENQLRLEVEKVRTLTYELERRTQRRDLIEIRIYDLNSSSEIILHGMLASLVLESYR